MRYGGFEIFQAFEWMAATEVKEMQRFRCSGVQTFRRFRRFRSSGV